MALAGAEDRALAVGAVGAQAGMRLDIGLVHRLGGVAALDDDLGVLEAGLDVALVEVHALGDVRGLGRLRLDARGEQVVVQHRRVVRHRRLDVDDVAAAPRTSRRSVRAPRRRSPAMVAATAATAWPSYSALPRAMQLRDRSRKFIGPSPTNASSEGMSGKSAAVTTAFTPGSFSALRASIDTMRACACGERFTLPHSMPGITMSAPNMARPVTLSTPSGRIGRVPTTFRSDANVIHRAASPRISAAASITARMILS